MDLYFSLWKRSKVRRLFFELWQLTGERPPMETLLVDDRPLTKAEREYGASLEEKALQILKQPNNASTRTGSHSAAQSDPVKSSGSRSTQS